MDFDAKSIATILSSDTEPPVFLCIGTDRVTGDALGPLVGDALTRRFNLPCFVYGTLALPVTALTLCDALAFIGRRHRGRTLFAVDSSLGSPADIGKIRLTRGGIRPGRATGKDLPLTGDAAITATVAPLGERNALSSVRLGLVVRLAEDIASTVADGIREWQSSRRSSRPSSPLAL